MKSDSEDSVVSIHSIVTDNQNFDSDNEAPEDKIGDVQKIVKNHVLKEILIPSKSFIKPGNNDLITINYICYINKEDILEEKTTRVYLRKLPVCKGLVQAILHMRLNETARVTIYPKYGYRKYNEKSGYDLPEKIRNKSDDLLENLRKATLFYEISLKEVVKMYDLTGKGEMMKYILTSGKGLLKPKEKDQVNFSLKVMLDSEIVININEERRLDETHLNQCEVIMIKSMKKGETSKIEILPSYLNQFDSNILNNKKFNNNTRIIYELTLIDFIENNERFTKKGKLYQVFIINKGIGNICPWRNCSLRVRFKILHNDKELYSTFDVAIDESERLKKIKTTIKKVPNHLNIVNFLLDKTIYEEDLKTDLINLNFKLIPSEVFETIIAMRPLEYSRITFKDLDYFKINDFELIDLKGDLTVFINVLDFVNNDIFASLSPEERLTNILLYKNNGNYLFKLNLLHKAKSNYKYIINEFEKEYNLIKNKKEVSSNIYTTEVKKVYFNIINCHIKLNNLILAQEIIKKYLECFDENDEKILYLKMTVFKLKNEEENLLQTAEKLNNLFPKEEYINLIKSTKEKLLKNEKDKKKLMKKLIKNI